MMLIRNFMKKNGGMYMYYSFPYGGKAISSMLRLLLTNFGVYRLDMNVDDRFYPLGAREYSETVEDSGMEQDMEMDEPEFEMEEPEMNEDEESHYTTASTPPSRKRRFSDVVPPGSEIGIHGTMANRKKARCHMPSASLGSNIRANFNS